MRTDRDLDRYLDAVIGEGLYSNKGNLRFEMDTLFSSVDLSNKRILDIGGGSGIYCHYAVCRGAKRVVCLEPEANGSSRGVSGRFERLGQALGCDVIELRPVRLQSWDPKGETFDVVLLHNSINHLDVDACAKLQWDSRSRDIYRGMFSKIYSLLDKGGKILICDCSRHNLFAWFGLRNPFAPAIDWRKHQPPEVWAALMGEVGFANPKIRWASFNTLRILGRVLMGNRVVAYLLTSHFNLVMERP